MFKSFLLLSLSVAALCATDGNGNFHWTGKLVPGQLLEIKGINGTIRAEATSGKDAEVIAYKSARRSNPSDVQIEMVENDNGVTICAVYPSSDGKPEECRPGDGARNAVGGNDVVVDFAVRVPPGVRFTGRTINGSIGAERLSADVEAHTVSGRIDIRTAGVASATAVNGSIRAILTGSVWREPRSFSTINGSVEVDVQPVINAAIQARTVNGRIDSDFPVCVHGGFSNRSVHGTVGRGGPGLNIRTVNGSIRLRRIGNPSV